MKQAIIDTDTLSYFFRNHSTVVNKLDTYWELVLKCGYLL
jgi:hypothetical protein